MTHSGEAPLRADPGRCLRVRAHAALACQTGGVANETQRQHDGDQRRSLAGRGEAADLLERVAVEVEHVIVGQQRMVERMLVALLARGHCLLEGVPGVAKTLAVSTLATVVGGSFARLQFTPDLVPSDVMGTRVYRGSTGEFDVELGPVFVNFVLADEINRAPAKVQSALLEVMAEGQVSLGGRTYPVPQPFLVLATQNPIESEGVYALPEAQRDRFLMRVQVPYPRPSEELEIVRRMGTRPPVAQQVLQAGELQTLQETAEDVFVHHAVAEYAVRLVLGTREPATYGIGSLVGALSYGASPRASLGLVAGARALALLRGRDYVVPADVADVAPEVLAHRLVLSYDALAEGAAPERLIDMLLGATPQPRIAARQVSGTAPETATEWESG